jgi:hypothetical protein
MMYPLHHDGKAIETMDLDGPKQPDIFYASYAAHKFEDSSCSTSSFVSATSNPYEDASEDHLMETSESSAPLEHMIIADKAGHATYEPYSITANMTLLDLRGSQRLTDRGLLQLTDLGRLEVARLDNCHALVGRGLVALGSSHRLHTLS